MPTETINPLQNTTVVILMGTFVPQKLQFVYSPLVDIFTGRGYDVKVVGLPSWGLSSLDDAANTLDELIFTAGADERYILVGHSQGGVHTLDLATRHPDSVLAVFNFAAPHHGTRLANLGYWVTWMPAVRGMKAHSTHLHNLRTLDYDHERIHSLFTVFDEFVVPWFASSIHGAHNVVLAPSIMHGLLGRVGFKRSPEVQLVHGYAGHLLVIWHRQFHKYIERTLDELEAQDTVY
ncbi:MAG: alpha/beta hydrolase [bacterium]